MTQPESDLGKEIERLNAEIASLKSELHKARQWVSVKERLPEASYDVLVSDIRSGDVVLGCFHKGFGWVDDLAFGPPTHWQELPEPPKE